jgi:DNA ligase (NAD+)
MILNSEDIGQLKKLAKAAKNTYYNTDKFLKVHTKQLTENVAKLLIFGRIVNNKIVARGTVPNTSIEVTDSVYDLIEDALKLNNIKPTVGAPVAKQKVKLPFKMASLDKVKPGEGTVKRYSDRNPGPYLISDKLDGVSIALVFSKNQPTKAYTRGDGVIGGDISFLVPHLKLPKYNGDLAVRGEVIMQKSSFKKFEDEFRNARNMTSGIVNKKGVHSAIADVDVIIYEVLSPRGVPSKQLAALKAKGFNVVPYKVVSRISDELLSSVLKTRRAKAKYDIDGIVVTRDTKTALSSDGNPSYAVAFKESGADNLATAKVVKVWWEVSKHRMLKPRVEIEPVELSGVTVKFATAYNAAYVRDNLLGPGAIVELTRSGDVIPKILKVVKPARKPQMPEEEYQWNKTNVDILLLDEVQHSGSEVKRIASFISEGLGVEHVASGIIAKLYDAGFDTIGKLLKAKPSDFLRVPGIQSTMANKIYKQIDEKRKSADINKVAANIGVFGLGMGSRRIKVITDKYDLFELAKLPESKIFARVLELPGFSTITAKQISTNLKLFVETVSNLPIEFKTEVVAKLGTKLSGQYVIFTGVRDTELEKTIQQQGGSVVSSIGKATILIAKDKNSGSSKNAKAIELGLPIYTIDEFVRKYKL